MSLAQLEPTWRAGAACQGATAELVAVIPGPNPEQLVAYLKRPLT
jgi:hypothetical protein